MSKEQAIGSLSRAHSGYAKLSTLLSESQKRSFGLIAVLIVVWLVLQCLTQGLFLTPRNLTNLSGQAAITAILAAGVVMIMVPGFIDLSIGATVSFCAVTAAMASSNFNCSTSETILITLVVGLIIGGWHAVWIAWLRVPAFIVTLASLLAVRGLSLVVTSSQTLSPQQGLLFISNATLSSALGAVVLVALWGGLCWLQLREYRAQQAAGISAATLQRALLPMALTGLLILAAILVSATYRGMPIPVLVLLVVMVMVGGMLGLTGPGRRLYAIGGNRQAARLAGISIAKHTAAVFIAMGFLYGIAGLILVSRLASAPPDAGTGLELDVIAAAVIGGTSLMGGRGTVIGAVIGAVLMESLSNGMSLMNLPSAYQSIVVGLVLLLAVYADVRSQGRGRLGLEM